MKFIEKAVKHTAQADQIGFIHSDEHNDAPIQYSKTRVVKIQPEVLKKNRIINPDESNDVISKSYKIIRTRVLQQVQEHDWNTLAVTSAGPGEGKTTTAINLSIALSMSLDYTVLLVDLDFRRPSIHSCFGIKPDAGLSDYFTNSTPLEDIMLNPGIERLTLLPQRSSREISSEILSSYKMSKLIDELKNRYPKRLVIFDLPPILGGDDVLAFSSCAEAMLLVVEDGKTNSKDLGRAAEILHNTNIIGSVLNKTPARHHIKTGY